MNRRGFLRGAGALLFAAPAIVRASSLMAISPVKPLTLNGVPLVFDVGPVFFQDRVWVARGATLFVFETTSSGNLAEFMRA